MKNATNTEDGLRERMCACGETQQRVIPASKKEYTISYNNLKSADYPTPNGYNSNEGLLNLPKPESVGYKFIGWYTASIGGDLVDYIPKNSTQDYVLFAHWELITYDITYKSVPNNTNPTSYDIEDKLKLQTPEWSGLMFTYWSDEDGNIYTPEANITSLPEKITGDLILTAHWKVPQNIAVPAESGFQLYSDYSSEDGFIYFIYDIGTIENVVLDRSDLYNKQGNFSRDLTSSKTVTISEEVAKSIANTVSNSISKTDVWEETKDWAKTHTDTFNAQIGASIELENKVLTTGIKAKIEGLLNTGEEDSTTNGWTSSTGGSTTEDNTNSETISTSIAYKQEITSDTTVTYSISGDLPNGYYACVNAGNIRVIAVISYDISTGSLYLNTYTRLDNMHSMIMYYENVNQLNNPSVEGLAFEITEEIETKILHTVKNSYYVKYDANGGTGNMPTTMHFVGAEERLPNNTFTRDNYKFVGWELETDDGIQSLQDGQMINNLANPLETVTLKAKWEYALSYVRDGDYIYFGEYPQTIKSDDVTITSTIDDRGYYLGSDGCYYAEVVARTYYQTTTYTFSTGATITNDEVYYFKVEPIRWRILSESNGKAFILCDSIIANMSYHSTYTLEWDSDIYYSNSDGVPNGTYANNYKYSEIRSWLNDQFYKTAFSDLQQQIILTTEVDNSAISTGASSNPYICENTYDKVFLLSYDEVTNSEYGLSLSSRKMFTSDYTRSTGVYMETNLDNYGEGYWRLRSPSSLKSQYTQIVFENGNIEKLAYMGLQHFGVVPAIWITL